MSLKTKTTIHGNGYEIDVELSCRADPGRTAEALEQTGRLRSTIKEIANA